MSSTCARGERSHPQQSLHLPATPQHPTPRVTRVTPTATAVPVTAPPHAQAHNPQPPDPVTPPPLNPVRSGAVRSVRVLFDDGERR
eukprot:7382702-Prymnesium_polylepis.1